MAMENQMPDVCLNLLTGQRVFSGTLALERIWSLNNWLSSVGRVKNVDISVDTPDRQIFRLCFDADRAQPDEIEVERLFKGSSIEVIHRVPPPGICSLSARWWAEDSNQGMVYARRKIIMKRTDYSPEIGRKMFRLMKENLSSLLKDVTCAAA